MVLSVALCASVGRGEDGILTESYVDSNRGEDGLINVNDVDMKKYTKDTPAFIYHYEDKLVNRLLGSLIVDMNDTCFPDLLSTRMIVT